GGAMMRIGPRACDGILAGAPVATATSLPSDRPRRSCSGFQMKIGKLARVARLLSRKSKLTSTAARDFAAAFGCGAGLRASRTSGALAPPTIIRAFAEGPMLAVR